MKKNDTAAVKITDIGVNGEGIGKVDGYTLFIKDAVIGDTVEAKVMKAKKNYGYARLMKVLSPSPDRSHRDAGSPGSAAAVRYRRCPTGGSSCLRNRKCAEIWSASAVSPRSFWTG